MTDHPTANLETDGAGSEPGAEAVFAQLNAGAKAWQNEGILYIQANPRRTIGLAIVAGLIAGRLAFR